MHACWCQRTVFFSVAVHFVVWDRFSHWTWSSFIGLGWLASELWGSACLYHQVRFTLLWPGFDVDDGRSALRSSGFHLELRARLVANKPQWCLLSVSHRALFSCLTLVLTSLPYSIWIILTVLFSFLQMAWFEFCDWYCYIVLCDIL